ncbi:replication protein [Oceanobacillus luteolus]|uniref:replication protein n=1 Tax=Oceanobacillus luteolus TaxID=1274358 RepID=UPI00203F13BD|nr:replication protein [Oceanobacillus luteolus]MCM3739201.1 replication protein [Oceanobacillus luteolus]
MADVQKENGYTPIAHELLEEIPKYKFNGTQFKIIMVVWRYTYGFHRKSHDFSLSFLTDATGADKSTIKKQLTNLIDDKVLQVVEEASFNKPRKLAFNKNYPEWKIQRTTQGVKSTEGDKPHPHTGGQNTPSQGVETPTLQGGDSPPLQGAVCPPKIDIIKDTSKDNIKDITTKKSPEVVSENILNRYMELRGQYVFSPKDEMAAKEIALSGIPAKDAIQYLEEKFQDYEKNKRHSRDKINALSYCVGYILDRYHDSKESEINGEGVSKYSRGYEKQGYSRNSGKSSSYEQQIRELELANQAFGR